uniref:AAA+ ATPase domain-containing protein n=1 Tax=Fagus sylvatica TaxID=28930 RepID=A0A2N9HQT7_FAGSY
MEVAGAAVGAVLGPICKLLCGCVSSKMTTALNLPSNLDVLVTQMKSLVDRREEVKDENEAAKKEGKEIRAQVVTWLVDVENLELKVNPIQEEMVNKKKPSACFLNCNKRYRESRKVEEILEEIKRLLQAGIFANGMVNPSRGPRAVEHIPGPSIQGQTTASKTLDKTMSLLYDDRYRNIGIWGLGGVGKTTLVQTQIAQRLNLEVKTDESVGRMAIRLHQRLINEEKFLLILDDVWAKIDLDTLGVPQPEVHKGCKIILTSRRKEVCRSMFTDFDVKIDVLNDEEAWQLFCQKAGDVFNDEKIKALAEAIVRECCGLPLAIIVVGAAMRRKEKVELWEHALNELRRSVPFVEDIEVEVYKPLKWSYDSLQGNNIKSCFLYCSLFPEDYTIEVRELVQCWLGEGLIDEQPNHVDRVNTGMALIEKLKDSCLLEDGAYNGSVRMHDVVRDVAIWIASSCEDGYKSLVRSGIGLSEISVGEFSNSNSLKRVSFMMNNITMLPDCVIQCSEASTLLLQHNGFLQTVPEKFLQGFEALKVLDLNHTSIQSLPLSLLQLGDLRAINLRDCKYLEELPPLGGLSRLQILDLRNSKIRELPKGMEKLSNLRQLNLCYTMNLKNFQVKIISRLPRLEVLNMTHIAYYFNGNGAEETTFEELRHLDRLQFLCISLERIPHLSSEDLSWINRLKGFQILIDPEIHLETRKKAILQMTKRLHISVRLISHTESIGAVMRYCRIAESLFFIDCQGLDGKIIDLDINSICHGLKSLKFQSMKFNKSSRPNGGIGCPL